MYYMLYFFLEKFKLYMLRMLLSVTDRAKVSKCPNTSTCSME
jgi:hypothetical protein